MPRRGRATRRPRRRDFSWDIVFAAQVRQARPAARAGLLGWMRGWRLRPDRVFWIIDDVGHWTVLS